MYTVVVKLDTLILQSLYFKIYSNTNIIASLKQHNTHVINVFIENVRCFYMSWVGYNNHTLSNNQTFF